MFLLDLGSNLTHNSVMFGLIIPGNWVRLTLAVGLLVFPSSNLSGQQGSFNRLVLVTITDPLNRFVTGLDRDNFEIIENGSRRAITSFSGVDDPIAVAVVSEAPLTDLGTP
jgi:hypothetical protein